MTVISYQRCPWAPLTTPIGLPAASRIGPCSICASEIRGERPAADRFRTGEADPLELGAEGDAGHIVGAGETLRKVEDAGEHAGADHRRRETRTPSLVQATISIGASVS